MRFVLCDAVALLIHLTQVITALPNPTVAGYSVKSAQLSAWKNFLADPEWIRIKKQTTAQWGDLVDDVQDRSLDMLPYTPKPSLVP